MEAISERDVPKHTHIGESGNEDMIVTDVNLKMVSISVCLGRIDCRSTLHSGFCYPLAPMRGSAHCCSPEHDEGAPAELGNLLIGTSRKTG